MTDTDRGIRRLRQQTWCWTPKHILLPLGDLALGQRMMNRLRFLERAQWWPPERLADERDPARASLVRIAYAEAPFYRELMDKARVQPEEIRTSADLVRLPIVTKQTLRDGYPARVSRATGRKTFESATSGSTVANFRFLVDSETAGWSRASFLLALEWAGFLRNHAGLLFDIPCLCLHVIGSPPRLCVS